MMIILLTGILTDNFVLSKFMGICPFLGVSKNPSGSLGMGLAVTFVMACATAVTYPLYYGFLVPMGLTYLNTILFILIIAVFVQMLEMFLKKFVPALYKSLGVYLPLITTNCAVLGVTLLNLENNYTFLESGRRTGLHDGDADILRSTRQAGALQRSESVPGNADNPRCRFDSFPFVPRLRRYR